MTRNLLTTITMMLCAILSKTAVQAQANIISANGYTVHVSVNPVSIVPSTTYCPYGYNYNVNLSYSVTFTGTNIPASLYTLQGTIGCGSSTHFFSLPTNGGTGNVVSVSNVWNSGSTCTTATPASLLCNNALIQIEGPGIAAQTVSLPYNGNRILPIQLLNFNTEAGKGQVKITWSTSFESNSNFFTIERSADNQNWAPVATLKAAGNSSVRINYENFDEKPLQGKSYYRLKQTDLDGKFNYSDAKLVVYSNGDNIYAYPAPNAGNTVSFAGIAQPKNIRLVLHDVAGSQVYSTTLDAAKIELPQIKPGMYTISLYNTVNGAVTNLKYIKL